MNKEDLYKTYNFDEPNAIDWNHFKEALVSLIHKKPFTAPVYDMEKEKRSNEK